MEGDESERAKREGEDPVVLRLKVYRSLGIDVEMSASGTSAGGEGKGIGGFDRAVVRSKGTEGKGQGDVHVVKIEPRFSRFFYANYFWGVM